MVLPKVISMEITEKYLLVLHHNQNAKRSCFSYYHLNKTLANSNKEHVWFLTDIENFTKYLCKITVCPNKNRPGRKSIRRMGQDVSLSEKADVDNTYDLLDPETYQKLGLDIH